MSNDNETASEQEGSPYQAHGRQQQDCELTGHWRKVAQDLDTLPYPDEVEFSPDGLYQGTRGESGKSFTIWDVGDYTIVGEGQARISTANDKKITYDYNIRDGEVTFVDSGGNKVRYKRTS